MFSNVFYMSTMNYCSLNIKQYVQTNIDNVVKNEEIEKNFKKF